MYWIPPYTGQEKKHNNVCSTASCIRQKTKTNKKQTKKHNTIYFGHNNAQTNTNNVNKTFKGGKHFILTMGDLHNL